VPELPHDRTDRPRPLRDTGLIDFRRVNAVEAICSAVERQVVGVSRVCDSEMGNDHRDTQNDFEETAHVDHDLPSP
jgi:hypothetical protein